MAIPTPILIGWKNLTLESGVTFVESSQDAAYPVENLAIAHPAKFWRITTLTGDPHTIIDLGPAHVIHLVAPLVVTASPHQNWLELSNSLDTWSASDLAVTKTVPLFLTGTVRRWLLNVDSGSVTPRIEKTYTKPNEALELTLSCYVDISNEGNGANLRLEMSEGANIGSVNIDLDDGSINSTATGGSFSGVSATSTLIEGTVYRITLTATVSTATTIAGKLRVLDSSYAAVYTDAGETLQAGGMQMELGASATAFIPSESGNGAASLWGISSGASTGTPEETGILNFPLVGDLQSWSREWLHSYYYDAAGWDTTLTGAFSVFFYDPHNADSQLDVSNIYAGPVWRPSFDLHKDFKASTDKFGRRIWDCTFPALTLDEYENQAEAMALSVGVGELDQTAAGGQDYGENRTPVVVILDPANPTQSQTLYGWIISYSATRISVETGDVRYTVKIRFREVLP